MEALKLTQQRVEELEKKFLVKGEEGDVPTPEDEAPKAEAAEFSELWQSRDQYPMIDREMGQPKAYQKMMIEYLIISYVGVAH